MYIRRKQGTFHDTFLNRCMLQLTSNCVFLTDIFSVHNVLEFLEDIELDAPNIWRYFAEIIGIPAADGYLPMKTLKDCVDMMHQKTSACKMLKEVLVKAVDCSVSLRGDEIDPFLSIFTIY